LAYPVRVGEHTNIAFGLTFPYEYAKCKLPVDKFRNDDALRLLLA
jgi:hypothetical protein